MKKKVLLMGICASILILIFARNVYRQINKDKDTIKTNREGYLRDEDRITVGEALRLAGYLNVDTRKLEEAVGNKKEEYLNFSQFQSILDLICSKYQIKAQEVQDKLDFSLNSQAEEKEVLTIEYLNVFETIISLLPKEKSPVKEKALYIIGRQKNSDSSADLYTMVTDQGNFTWKDSADYGSYYTEGVLHKISEEPEAGDDVPCTGYSFQPEDYNDCKVIALVKDSELIYIKGESEEETTLHNVWIKKGNGDTISAFLNDVSRDFKAKYNLSKEIKGEIGDLVIKDKEVIKISLKPDTINGKVLVAGKDYIEVEGYGKVGLDKYYKIYKIYGELSMEVTNSILVGYQATDFVVADGKIVAALIKEEIKAENIRVIIKTNNYASLFHDKVQLTATKDFTVTIGKDKKTYKAGKKVTFKPGDAALKKGRIRIDPKSGTGKIKLLTVKRASGTPAYRGAIEIAKTKDGLLVINELPIEEYLYAVIPSEMPTSYGLEALKVQAVCARSYAYKQVFANGYGQYGAHVDDSVSYQVYNNNAENKDSILAVKDTYGKILKYKDDVITAYYFSTSCGHTASVNEVWGEGTKADYLVGKLQTKEDKAVTASASFKDNTDYSSEAAFQKFILNPKEDTYDSGYSWYRWKVTLPFQNIKAALDNNLANRYNANPALIQTLVNGKVDDDPVYESRPVNTIGTVKKVLVGKREKSGILSQVIFVGSKCTIKVMTEYNIRLFLAPGSNELALNDGSTVTGLKMLPSGFFTMDKEGDKLKIRGGGYGHGVGMSQNGVKTMADMGNDYETILKHYYTGAELGFIY